VLTGGQVPTPSRPPPVPAGTSPPPPPACLAKVVGRVQR
jgi:hypothetical protein